jgi:hypothetical protein
MTILLEAPRGGTADEEESAYYVKDPTGKVRRHARASSYTGLLDDDFKLRQNKDRMLAHGIGKRKDLAALARSHDPKVDKDVYDQNIIPSARAAAESDARANHGTSFHKDTELLDQGAQPAALDLDLIHHYRAYLDTFHAGRLPFLILHEHTEQVIIVDGHQVAGTIDRIAEVLEEIYITFSNGRKVHLLPGDLIIIDIKSGAWGLEYNAIKWPIQLAIYAHHTATWHPDPDAPKDPEKGERGPRVDVRADVALVFHLDAGDPAATPHLHWLDLELGYDNFLLAVSIKDARRLARKGHCQYTDHLPTAIDTQMEAWARARLESAATTHADPLRRLWPLRDPDTGHPVKYDGGPEQTVTLLAFLDRFEAELGLPFIPQPGTTPSPTTGKETKAEPKRNPRRTTK